MRIVLPVGEDHIRLHSTFQIFKPVLYFVAIRKVSVLKMS